MKITKVIGGGLFAFALATSPQFVHAQTGPFGDELAYQVPDGPVQVYGQTLRPNLIENNFSGYSWKDLKDIMSMVLPEAQSSSKTAEGVCDEVSEITKLYFTEAERSDGFFEKVLVDILPKDMSDEEFDMFFPDRIATKAGLAELLKLLPDYQEQLLVAHEINLKAATLAFLNDAALENCPEHAKEKGYSYYLSYDGSDKDYDPDKDPGWADFKAQFE